MKQVRVQGYRSLRDITWLPTRLNVLIGPNGSGKSNLLRALQLLSEAAAGKLKQAILNEGGMGSVLSENSGKVLNLGCELEPDAGAYEPYSRMIYDLALSGFLDQSLHVVTRERLSENNAAGTVSVLERDHQDMKVYEGHRIPFTIPRESVPDTEALISHSPREPHSLVRVRDYLQRLAIYHQIHVAADSELRRSALVRREHHLHADGKNLIPVLHTLYTTNPQFEEDVDSAMSAAFPDDYEKLLFAPGDDQRIQLRLRRKRSGRLDSALDLSDGTIRFLLLLAILANPYAPSLIAIDEPEVGLHPRMMAIIAELAQQAAPRSQVILTTHSPEFLDAFRSSTLSVSVFGWDGASTTLSTLSGDELKTWIADYSLGRFCFSGEAEAAL